MAGLESSHSGPTQNLPGVLTTEVRRVTRLPVNVVGDGISSALATGPAIAIFVFALHEHRADGRNRGPAASSSRKARRCRRLLPLSGGEEHQTDRERHGDRGSGGPRVPEELGRVEGARLPPNKRGNQASQRGAGCSSAW